MSDTLQQVLAARKSEQGVAVKYGDRQWTWNEYLAGAEVRAAALIAMADPDRPFHVGVLLGNTPDMLEQMASAGLGGYVLCGLNTTRRGEALAADIRRADCQIVVTDATHRPLLAGLDLHGIRVFETATPEWQTMIAESPDEFTPYRLVEPLDTFMMIFTSGTSGDPKAVQVSHFMVFAAGMALVQRFSLSRHRHLLCVDAAVSFQRSGRRMGTGGGGGRSARARQVFGIKFSRRRPPVRSHVHELRRQTPRLHPVDSETI